MARCNRSVHTQQGKEKNLDTHSASALLRTVLRLAVRGPSSPNTNTIEIKGA
jgi:hypothetical protein